MQKGKPKQKLSKSANKGPLFFQLDSMDNSEFSELKADAAINRLIELSDEADPPDSKQSRMDFVDRIWLIGENNFLIAQKAFNEKQYSRALRFLKFVIGGNKLATGYFEYVFQKGVIDQGLYDKAVFKFRQREANCYLLLGHTQFEKAQQLKTKEDKTEDNDKYKQAVDFYNRCIGILVPIAGNNVEIIKFIASTYFPIAEVHFAVMKYKEMHECHNRGIESLRKELAETEKNKSELVASGFIKEHDKDWFPITQRLLDMAYQCYGDSNHEDAKLLYQKAIFILNAIHDKTIAQQVLLAECNASLAAIAVNLNNHEGFRTYTNEAITIIKTKVPIKDRDSNTVEFLKILENNLSIFNNEKHPNVISLITRIQSTKTLQLRCILPEQALLRTASEGDEKEIATLCVSHTYKKETTQMALMIAWKKNKIGNVGVLLRTFPVSHEEVQTQLLHPKSDKKLYLLILIFNNLRLLTKSKEKITKAKLIADSMDRFKPVFLADAVILTSESTRYKTVTLPTATFLDLINECCLESSGDEQFSNTLQDVFLINSREYAEDRAKEKERQKLEKAKMQQQLAEEKIKSDRETSLKKGEQLEKAEKLAHSMVQAMAAIKWQEASLEYSGLRKKILDQITDLLSRLSKINVALTKNAQKINEQEPGNDFKIRLEQRKQKLQGIQSDFSDHESKATDKLLKSISHYKGQQQVVKQIEIDIIGMEKLICVASNEHKEESKEGKISLCQSVESNNASQVASPKDESKTPNKSTTLNGEDVRQTTIIKEKILGLPLPSRLRDMQFELIRICWSVNTVITQLPQESVSQLSGCLLFVIEVLAANAAEDQSESSIYKKIKDLNHAHICLRHKATSEGTFSLEELEKLKQSHKSYSEQYDQVLELLKNYKETLQEIRINLDLAGVVKMTPLTPALVPTKLII